MDTIRLVFTKNSTITSQIKHLDQKIIQLIYNIRNLKKHAETILSIDDRNPSVLLINTRIASEMIEQAARYADDVTFLQLEKRRLKQLQIHRRIAANALIN